MLWQPQSLVDLEVDNCLAYGENEASTIASKDFWSCIMHFSGFLSIRNRAQNWFKNLNFHLILAFNVTNMFDFFLLSPITVKSSKHLKNWMVQWLQIYILHRNNLRTEAIVYDLRIKSRHVCGHVHVSTPSFGSHLNPISTREGRLCPPYTGVHTKFWKPQARLQTTCLLPDATDSLIDSAHTPLIVGFFSPFLLKHGMEKENITFRDSWGIFQSTILLCRVLGQWNS